MSSPFLDAAAFLPRGLADYLESIGARRTDAPSRAIDEFAALWGHEPDPALDGAFRTLAAYDGPTLSVFTPSLGVDRETVFAPLALPSDGNVLETLAGDDRHQFLAPAFGQALAGGVFFGTTPRGDGWFYGADHHHVHLCDHESGLLGPPVARGMDAFLSLVAASDAIERGHADADAARDLLATLAGRVDARGFEGAAGVLAGRAADASKSNGAFLYQRARWLGLLLADRGIAAAQRQYHAEQNAFPDAQWEARLAASDKRPSSAAYLLLRCFFLGEDDRARQLVVRHAGRTSRIARDVAATVGAWLSGRDTSFGTVGDIGALRHTWRSVLAPKPLAGDADPLTRLLAYSGGLHAEGALQALAALRDEAQIDPRMSRLGPLLLQLAPGAKHGAPVSRVACGIARLLGAVRARETTAALLEILSAFPRYTVELAGDYALGSVQELAVDVIDALGRIGNPKAAPALLALLDETAQTYTPLKLAACDALARLEVVEALPKIERFIRAYGGIPGPAVAWALGELLAASPDSFQIPQSHVDTLVAGVNDADHDPARSIAAGLALVRIGTMPPSGLADAVARALAKAPGPHARRDREAATWALRAIEECPELDAEPARSLAAGSDLEMRVAAQRALRKRLE